MNRTNGRRLTAGLAIMPAAALAAGAAAGPVLLSGDGAETHGAQGAYAHLLDILLDNVTNGQTGILAVGVDLPSPAANWLMGVSAQMDQPQAVAFINDATIGVFGFSGYALVFVPSPSTVVSGGITQAENDLLNGRAVDLANFLTAGGGLVALTQGDLDGAYEFLGDFAPVSSIGIPANGQCVPAESFNNVTPTESGNLFGISAGNIDGCCWHNVFSAFPEALVVLASAAEPNCPAINGQAAVLTGFVELPPLNFFPPDQVDAAGAPNVESVGDLDGNGTIDVAAVIPGPTTADPGLIQVFLNNGTDKEEQWLGLKPQSPIQVGANPTGIGVGQFTADEHPDMAVVNQGDDTISVLINTGNGDGTFNTPATIIVPGSAPHSVVAIDFTGDGLTDLAVTLEGDGTVILLIGDGNGGFATESSVAFLPPVFAVGPNPVSMTSGDFDNNKDDDLAGTNNTGAGLGLGGGGGTVFVLKSLGGGNFAPAAFYNVGDFPVDLAIADFNGDGYPDIATSDKGVGTVSVLINNQDGTFAPAFALEVGDSPKSVEAADLSDDGDPDIAVVAVDPEIGPAVQVLRNRIGGALLGAIPFDPPQSLNVGPNADPNFVVSADMDGNGVPDLVTVNSDPQSKTSGSTTVLLNNPNPVECPGDFDGDGFVNVDDLLELIGAWGPCDGGCPTDLNGDGEVNVLDVLAILGIWGPCPQKGECPADLTGDGVVNGHDIVELLQHLGPCDDPKDCPWDLDGDGHVGLLDLLVIVTNLGPCPGE